MELVTINTETPTRTKSRKPAKRRQAILEAATEIFLEHGYGAATINALVKKLGGSKATIYNHFKNKEALFEAVAEHILEENMTAIRSYNIDGLNLYSGLMSMGNKLLELVSSEHHIRLARLVITETPNFPEVGLTYYTRGPAAAYEELASFLKSKNEQHDNAFKHPTAAADHFTSLLTHKVFMERLCGNKKSLPKEERLAIVQKTVSNFIKIYGLSEELNS